LAGAKKIQQVISDDSILARFIPNAEERQLVQSSFIELLPLNAITVKRALKNPRHYVLKPQSMENNQQ
jgi:hypothetical protein